MVYPRKISPSQTFTLTGMYIDIIITATKAILASHTSLENIVLLVVVIVKIIIIIIIIIIHREKETTNCLDGLH